MEINKFSFIGYGLAILGTVVTIIFATSRYIFKFDDPFKFALSLLIGVTLAVGVSICSYIYNWMKFIDKELSEQDKRILAILNWKNLQEVNKEWEVKEK